MRIIILVVSRDEQHYWTKNINEQDVELSTFLFQD